MTIKRSLTLHNIDKSIGRKMETIEVSIDKGHEKWLLDIRLEFDKVGINNVVQGLANVYDKVGVILGDEIFTPYVYLLIIKEFTSLGEDIPNDFESQTEIMTKLIQEDLFLPIIESLPKEEVEKVIKHINDVTKLINKNSNNLQEKIKGVKLENKEVLDSVLESE